MSRLIDADKFLDFIKSELKQHRTDEKHLENIICVLENLPTAFDVDKVISNIWDRSELIHIKHNCYDEVEDYIRVTDVSEIVKAGGIDEYDRE